MSQVTERSRVSQPPEAESQVCQHILQRLGEGGQPPEYGVGRINVGNDSYLRVLEHEYFRRHLTFGSSFKLVQGYFGGGKTHFLYVVRELAWRYGFATAVVELSPAECPYDDSLKVYRAVARRLGLEPARPMAEARYGLPEVLRGLVLDAVEGKRPARAPRVMGGGGGEDGAEALERWLTRVLRRAPCESHSYRQAVVGFCRAVVRGDEAAEGLLEAWLLGEPVPLGELRTRGVYEGIDHSNGFTMLRCLTQMIVGVGLPGTALLFDEVDRTLSVSAKRSQVIGDNLRQVIDLCGRHQLPNTLFMYAVPPEFMRNVVPDYAALYQRLKSPVPLSVRSPQAVLIDLERLDLEPEALLTALGERLVAVFNTARGAELDGERQAKNAGAVARACANAYFEVNHRRLFVKTWVDLMFRQVVDGERELTDDQAVELVLAGYEALEQEAPPDELADF
jgi:hypothetical protein